jgi:Golgi apparatus protein 1
MVDLIHDESVQELSQHACDKDLSHLGCKATGETGVLLACMIDNRESIKSVACHAFIQRMEWVAFSDFRIITHFTSSCQKDIAQTGCGRLQADKVCCCNIIVYLVFLYGMSCKE